MQPTVSWSNPMTTLIECVGDRWQSQAATCVKRLECRRAVRQGGQLLGFVGYEVLQG